MPGGYMGGYEMQPDMMYGGALPTGAAPMMGWDPSMMSPGAFGSPPMMDMMGGGAGFMGMPG